jgi:hypothetical protein
MIGGGEGDKLNKDKGHVMTNTESSLKNVVKITDRRTVSYSFDQVKNAVKLQLIDQKIQDSLKALIDDLKKNMKIQINESLLK